MQSRRIFVWYPYSSHRHNVMSSMNFYSTQFARISCSQLETRTRTPVPHRVMPWSSLLFFLRPLFSPPLGTIQEYPQLQKIIYDTCKTGVLSRICEKPKPPSWQCNHRLCKFSTTALMLPCPIVILTNIVTNQNHPNLM